MPTYPAPVLEIIYGSATINLLARGKGWHLTGFRPRTAELKNGGTWQSSPLSNGRQPVSYRYDNIIDTWTVSADGYNEDGIIELAQELERAGVAALDYWTADWADTPVYIRARGPKETNTRYAIIHQIRVPEYADQYRQPMFGVESPVMDGISVIIEHGQWQNVAPGDQECVAVSSAFGWDFSAQSTEAMVGDVTAIIELVNGRILVGTDNSARVYRSDDTGATWSLLATIGGADGDRINAFAQNPDNGYIVCVISGGSSYNGPWRSVDNGGNWSRTANATMQRNLYAVNAENSEFLAAGGGSGQYVIGRSAGGDGSSWSNTTVATGGYIRSVERLADGRSLAGRDGAILRLSTSELVETDPLFSVSGENVTALFRASSGRIFAGTDAGKLYFSDNTSGQPGTWALLSSVFASGVFSLAESSSGVLYAGDTGQVWVSVDNGATWSVYGSTPTVDVTAILPASSGGIYFGGRDLLVLPSVDGAISVGSTASCDNQVYVANKSAHTNLTSVIFESAGGSFSSVYPFGIENMPYGFTSGNPSVGDILYWGIAVDGDFDYAPFSSLVFDIERAMQGSVIAWEYWNGSSWSALTIQDNTVQFSVLGVNSVHWVPPSNWATTTVNSVEAWWVRFRVTSVSATTQSARQQNREIYTVVNPYVEIAASQIGGDIPALARVRVENVSDRDGPGGSAPDLYTNRVIMGLRSVSRGALFTAYLNAADEQNPVGVTVTAGTDTAFANLVGAPSGRIAQWSPTGTGSWVTILTFSLATTIATQYYGTFRVFLRARQSGGTAGQMQLRLRTSTGSGGVSITTDAQVFANTNDHQIIDFGQLTIPLSAYLKSTELGDVLTIAVQGYTSSATPDANLYDLVLMPVDEWAADLTDGENSAASALASGFYLDVDSVSFPKRQLRNAVKSTGTNYTKAIWQQVANGPAILQANERQRLWLLTLRTASAGSSDWRSEPDAVHRVQMWSAERYRWARGSR